MLNPQDNTPTTNPIESTPQNSDPSAPPVGQINIADSQTLPKQTPQESVPLQQPAPSPESPVEPVLPVAPTPISPKNSKKTITMIAVGLVVLVVLVVGFIALKLKNDSKSDTPNPTPQSTNGGTTSDAGTDKIKTFVALIEADEYMKAHALLLENNGITTATTDKVLVEKGVKYGVSVGLLAAFLQKVDAVSYKTDSSKPGIVTMYYKYDRPKSKKNPVEYFTVTAKNSGSKWAVNDFVLYDVDPATKSL